MSDSALLFEEDPQALPLAPFPLELTQDAINKAIEAIEAEQLGPVSLRVGVVGGGCSGLQYLLDFVETPTETDLEQRFGPLSVVIDPFSAMHLVGTVIDYVDDLQHAGFKFNNPNIVRQCGCGSSFQT
jgi:iron-sulfur cluster assembly accessory protein